MVLVYDGDCGFCSTSARFLLRWVPTEARIVPWQRTDLGALGLTEEQADASVRWVDGDRHSHGAAAIAALLCTSRLPWRVVGRVLGSRVGLAVAEPVYGWVSRHRHRLPGGTPACRPGD